jgi:cytochrome c-type biogenesis protein
MAVADLLGTVAEFYGLGIFTAVTAFCVIVLYPAFLARAARQVAQRPEARDNQRLLALMGVLVSAGVVTFMAVVGFLLTYLLGESLDLVIGVISPIAFVFLLVIGVLLAFNIKTSRQVRPLRIKNPYLSAFVYGLLFGAVVVPCNPGVIVLAFTRASIIPLGERMAAFLAFGVGIATPLLAFSLVSRAASRWILNFLVKHKGIINRLAGIFMAGVAVYYLLFVFHVQDSILGLFG